MRPIDFAPFRWLAAGSTVNLLGNGIAPVALAFAVLDIGGSATDLGLVVAAYALADVAAVVFGGVLGDRLPRRMLMTGGNALAALTQGVAAASLLGHWSSLWLLALLAAANGALGSLSGPATQAVTQQTVPAVMLPRAITWLRLAKNLATFIGFGAAGMLVAGVGSGWALAADAVTFALAALCFSRLHVPAVVSRSGQRFLAEAREGLAEVTGRVWLWSLILMATLYHLFYGGSQGVLGPVVVGEHVGRSAWGFALAAMMAGFISGGVVSLFWRPRRLLYAGETFLVLTACFPAAMAFSDLPLLILAGAFLHGFGLEIFSVNWDVAIQQNVPADRLARVYSFDLLGSFIARPVGLALTGPVAAVVGERQWLGVVAAVLVLAAVVPLAIPDVRRLERAPAETEPLVDPVR